MSDDYLVENLGNYGDNDDYEEGIGFDNSIVGGVADILLPEVQGLWEVYNEKKEEIEDIDYLDRVNGKDVVKEERKKKEYIDHIIPRVMERIEENDITSGELKERIGDEAYEELERRGLIDETDEMDGYSNGEVNIEYEDIEGSEDESSDSNAELNFEYEV